MPKWVIVMIGLATVIVILAIAGRILGGAGGSFMFGKEGVEITVTEAQTTLASTSVQDRSEEDIKSNRVTIGNAATAIVFDPPSNVRVVPNGKVICSVTSRGAIRVYREANGWYNTDVCGEMGVIHKSQISFDPNSTK